MIKSVTYVCPTRGLHSLEPPEPYRLCRAAGAVKDLGIDRITLPLLEEPLYRSGKVRIAYLDGVVRSLDNIGESGAAACLVAPARMVLGLDWVPPYLVKAVKGPRGVPVFLEGRIRNLMPYDWWRDLDILQKRAEIFREICTAVAGHPALNCWIIMDRELDWFRPDPETADLVLKTRLSEIRERDEKIPVHIGISWTEFLDPQIVQALAAQVDGIRISGLDMRYPAFRCDGSHREELLMAAFLGAIADWLFRLPSELETGWKMTTWSDDPEAVHETHKRLSRKGLLGMNWLNLVDPEPDMLDKPPWVSNPSLGKVGLLDRALEPKGYADTWLGEKGNSRPDKDAFDFIDIGHEEYCLDPQIHLPRLWDHFRDSYR